MCVARSGAQTIYNGGVHKRTIFLIYVIATLSRSTFSKLTIFYYYLIQHFAQKQIEAEVK